MIYFPVYAHMKKDVFHEGRQGKVLSLGELLISAGVGGIPAGELHPMPTLLQTTHHTTDGQDRSRKAKIGNLRFSIFSIPFSVLPSYNTFPHSWSVVLMNSVDYYGP